MKPFSELTARGQALRLRQLAINALEHYPIEAERVTLIGNDWNCTFRIETTNGKKYFMRVNVPEYTLAQTRSELLWMDYLRSQTDITVPMPLQTIEGDYVAVASAEGVPEPRQCVVFSWVRGHTLEDITHEMAIQWGHIAARLHRYAAAFRPPPDFTRMVYDDIFYFNTDAVIMFRDEHRWLMKGKKRPALFQRGIERVQAEIDWLFDSGEPPRLLHGDLHLFNVMTFHKRLAVIDFEDMVWGYPVQDIGISMHHVHRRDDFEAIKAAFIEGYTSLEPWVEQREGQLEAMMLARQLNLFNLTLHITDRDYEHYLIDLANDVERRLKRYLDRYD